MNEFITLLSLNPSNAEVTFRPMHKNTKNYENPLNQGMWVFIEYFWMSTYVLGSKSFLSFLSSFHVDQVTHQQ